MKAVFDAEELREGAPITMPSFTMFVTSSEGLRETWGQREALDEIEMIFRDRIVLVKRDELFHSLVRASLKCETICSKFNDSAWGQSMISDGCVG
jgi:hypothetical protein